MLIRATTYLSEFVCLRQRLTWVPFVKSFLVLMNESCWDQIAFNLAVVTTSCTKTAFSNLQPWLCLLILDNNEKFKLDSHQSELSVQSIPIQGRGVCCLQQVWSPAGKVGTISATICQTEVKLAPTICIATFFLQPTYIWIGNQPASIGDSASVGKV